MPAIWDTPWRFLSAADNPRAAFPLMTNPLAFIVSEMMDGFNTFLMRDFVYGVVYARVLAHYRLR